MQTKKTIVWNDEGDHVSLGEPVFIGRPEASMEDDGNNHTLLQETTHHYLTKYETH